MVKVNIKKNLYSQAFQAKKGYYLEQAQTLDTEFDNYRDFLNDIKDLEKHEVTILDATSQAFSMKYDMCSLKLFVDDVAPALLQDAYYKLDILDQSVQEGRFYQGIDILKGSVLPFFAIGFYSSPLITVHTHNGSLLKVRAVIEYVKLPDYLHIKWAPKSMCIPWERYNRSGIYTGECLRMSSGAACIGYNFTFVN